MRYSPTAWKWTLRENGLVLAESAWIGNALTQEGELAILGTFFRNDPPSGIAGFGVGLMGTTAPNDAWTISNYNANKLSSGSSTSYAEQAVSRNTTDWTFDTSGTINRVKTKTVTFGPAGNTWQAARYIALVNTGSSQLIAYVDMGATITLTAGQSLDVSYRLQLRQ